MFIESAYAQGIRRSNQELRRAGYPVAPIESIPGGLRATISPPIHADRLAVLYTRTFEDLKSVTQFTNAQIRRRIADGLTTGLSRGLAEGKNPKVIARELYKDVANRIDKIGKVRARMIARTEVIRAHHVAAIQEYRRAQVEGIIIDVEWLTAGNPCPICADLAARGPYKVDEVESLIPVHPNCRCTTRPIPRLKEGG
jgi:SPP1 gp7 family putative phage head morphogenesis protein